MRSAMTACARFAESSRNAAADRRRDAAARPVRRRRSTAARCQCGAVSLPRQPATCATSSFAIAASAAASMAMRRATAPRAGRSMTHRWRGQHRLVPHVGIRRSAASARAAAPACSGRRTVAETVLGRRGHRSMRRPALKTVRHIFAADKGDYYTIADGVPQDPGTMSGQSGHVLNTMFASLGMYDLPELTAATDAWWAGLRRHFAAQGLRDLPADDADPRRRSGRAAESARA